MKLRCITLLLSAAACSSPTKEICGNAFDDDMNGLIDCADPVCANEAACKDPDAGYFGSCAKCGQSCASQQTCFGNNLLDDRPVAQCRAGKCELFHKAVSLRIEYNTSSWGGIMPSVLGVITTRWIKKTALDGSAVTCMTVRNAAPANNMPLQLEQSGKFQLLGIDVTRVSTAGGIPNPVTIPFAYTGEGSDYLIFSEAWSGGIDSSTRLPTGARQSVGCVESGSEIAPVTLAQECNGDGGVAPGCRTLRLPLPAP